jgi:hypothetical protein
MTNWWVYAVVPLIFGLVVLLRAADSGALNNMGTVGRRIESSINYRETRYRRLVAAEVGAALDKVLPKMAWEDWSARNRPDDVVTWLIDLEVENRAQRSFIIQTPQRRRKWLDYFGEWRGKVDA